MDKAPWFPNWKLDPMFDCVDQDESGDELDWRLSTYAMTNRGRESNEDWNCARLFNTASQFAKDDASREDFFLWIDCLTRASTGMRRRSSC